MASQVRNVVLIVADALRPDRVGAYSGTNLTPNIDRIGRDGEIFEECFACINATDSSVTTILTGLYPTRHGVINHGNRVTEEEKQFVGATSPLPELLPTSYYSAGVDRLGRWHKRGFDTYINPRNAQKSSFVKTASRFIDSLPSPIQKPIQETYRLISSDNSHSSQSSVTTQKSLEALPDNQSPFFLFTHYWDTHIPYVSSDNLPRKIRNRSYDDGDESLDSVLEPIDGSPWADRLRGGLMGDSTTVGELKRKYDAGVWNVDQAIGKIEEQLKHEGIYDETALIITADHGESFTEHGILFDHHGLYEPTVHVPLIIRAPGFEGREDQFIQHFDLVPTILDLIGKDYKKDSFDGVSLVEEGPRNLDRGAVFMEEGHTARKRAIRTNSYKYIKRLDDEEVCRYCEIRHATDEELYSLDRDPEEEYNVVQYKPEVHQRLDNQLHAWVSDVPDPTTDESDFETSQEVKDHLEEMGYL
mgnify:CR=1 FL=1